MGHKLSLSDFFLIRITLSILSDHNAARLDINYKKKKYKKHKHMETKQHASE